MLLPEPESFCIRSAGPAQQTVCLSCGQQSPERRACKSFPSRTVRRGQTASILLLLLIAQGCTPQAEIRTYRVPVTQEPDTTDRLRPLFQGNKRPTAVALPDFQVPSEWRQAENDQFSAAAFSAGPEDRAARITITQTPAAVGILGQVNRWRGQVGAEPLPADQTMDSFPTVSMGNIPASFVEIVGNDGESIAGAIASVAGELWFFKMRGPAETVNEELERLKTFCESVRFKDQN